MDVLKPSIAPYFIQCKSTLNFLRLCRLITTICSDLLRDILSRYIKPADLRSKLDANRTKLEKVMNAQQKEQIYNNTGNRLLSAKDLDISLLYILLRNLCNIPEHRNGWGKVPHLADKSIAACIERIRIQRNLISAHSTNGRVEESEFKNHWTELQDAVIEIENQMIGGDLYGRGINVLYSCDIDITLGQAEIYKRDLDRMQGPPNVITGCDTCIESNTVILIAQVFPYENLSGTEEVFWTKNGERINTQESNEKYSGIRIDYPSLTIKKVNQQDAGSYQFTATNSMGTTKSDIIVLDVPTISLQNTETKEDGSQLFKVRVESIPAPIFAIWKVKTTNDDKVFELLDINAEQYKGTLNSLPQPVLVVKQKECLETHLFQIEVYNFIGSSTTIIPTDLQPENIETDNIANDNLEMFYNNGGANVKFSNLFDDIAENIPEFKVNRLKDIIQNSCKLEDVGSLRRATSARDCIRILKNAKLFTASDVIFIQYVLKKLDCEELYSKCYIYAETQKALCFYEKPTENGYKNVQFHVRGNLTEYSTKQVKKIKETVAAILECSPEEIIVIGYCPSNSFFVVLSIKDAYLSKLLKIGESDKYKLSKLNIDYLIIDLFIFYIEPLKEQEWNIYFDQTRPRRSNDEKKSWKKQQTLAEGTRVLQEVTKYQEDQDDGYSYEFRTRSNSRESRDSGSCSIASHCSGEQHGTPKRIRCLGGMSILC